MLGGEIPSEVVGRSAARLQHATQLWGSQQDWVQDLHGSCAFALASLQEVGSCLSTRVFKHIVEKSTTFDTNKRPAHQHPLPSSPSQQRDANRWEMRCSALSLCSYLSTFSHHAVFRRWRLCSLQPVPSKWHCSSQLS
jgi:hypothetical protein